MEKEHLQDLGLKDITKMSLNGVAGGCIQLAHGREKWCLL